MNRMLEQRWWHPVAAAHELSEAPLAVMLLGAELVLWRDGAGAVHAFDDRCPHRGTKLSLGRVAVVEGESRLECAYHGWQFGGNGRCAHIPAVPAFEPAAAHAACAHAVREAHGLLWVRPALVPEAPADALTESPALGGLPQREVVCGPYEVATSAPRLVENFLDTSHFGFVHEGWLGDRAHTEVPSYEVERGVEGAPIVPPVVPHYRAWQPQASALAQGGAWVDYRYEVLSPYCALLVKQAGAGDAPQEAYALWVCPVEPERSRVWFTLFTSDASQSDESLRAFQDRIFSQDQPILEAQRPRRLPVSGGEVHSAADRMSTAYRRYLRELNITFGVC
jgi:phenylpropionate dioxygenase-like ring-hydroxylating dioxygenase large terminal subunit